MTTITPTINNETGTLRVGDILRCSWGYSMTLVQFAVVTRVTAKTATIQLTAGEGKSVDNDGFLGGHCVFDPEAPLAGEPIRLKIHTADDGEQFVREHCGGTFYKYWRLWSGAPQYFNHAD